MSQTVLESTLENKTKLRSFLFFENNVFIIPLKNLICDLFYDIILHINNPYNGKKESREE